MGFIKYETKEERDQARKDAYAKKQEFLQTPEGKLWKRNAQLKNLYGITLEDFNRMADGQGWCCKICDEETSLLHVDHCHSTGRIRGLLCRSCNTALGLLKGCTKRMSAAINYLKED